MCGLGVAVESVVAAGSRGPAVLNVLVALLAGVPLVVRRIRPVTACAGAVVALLVMAAWLTPPTAMVTPILVMLVCGYAAGAYAEGLGRVAGLAVMLGGSGNGPAGPRRSQLRRCFRDLWPAALLAHPGAGYYQPDVTLVAFSTANRFTLRLKMLHSPR